MAGPLKSFLSKAGEVASNVGGAVKDVASTVVDKVDDHLESVRGGKIRVPVSVVGGSVVVDTSSAQYIEIDPNEFDRV